jgi:hypothetical protein
MSTHSIHIQNHFLFNQRKVAMRVSYALTTGLSCLPVCESAYPPAFTFRGCFEIPTNEDGEIVDSDFERDIFMSLNKNGVMVDERYLSPHDCSLRCVDKVEGKEGLRPPLLFGIQGKGECWCGNSVENYNQLAFSDCDCTKNAPISSDAGRCIYDVPLKFDYQGCFVEPRDHPAMETRVMPRADASFDPDTSYQQVLRTCASNCASVKDPKTGLQTANYLHFGVQREVDGAGNSIAACHCGDDSPSGWRVFGEQHECSCAGAGITGVPTYPWPTNTSDAVLDADRPTSIAAGTANCVYRVPSTEIWDKPAMHSFEYSRATQTTILVSWEIGYHRLCNVMEYELQMRRPGLPPTNGFSSQEAEDAAHHASFAHLLDLKHSQEFASHWYDDLNTARLEHWQTPTNDQNVVPPINHEIGVGWWRGYINHDDSYSTDAWVTIYKGNSRSVLVGDENPTAGFLAPGHPYEFRVRAVDTRDGGCGASPWSGTLLMHTLWPANLERIPFCIRGTGRNNPDYSIVEINNELVYHDRTATGLLLMIFRRVDIRLVFSQVFNTMHSRQESEAMASTIREHDHSHFVVVVSSDAWEMRATQVLVDAMEFCGAYHFGQWANLFAEKYHYRSPVFDIDQTASQVDEKLFENSNDD